MKRVGLVVVIALAFGLVALALFMARPSEGPPRSRDKVAERDSGPTRSGDRATRGGSRGGEGGSQGANSRPDRPRPKPLPPAQPSPPPPGSDIPLEQARADLQDFLAELDERIENGNRFDSPDTYAEYYKRGRDLMDPLVFHLQSADPAQAKEVNDADIQIRERLSKLEPGAP